MPSVSPIVPNAETNSKTMKVINQGGWREKYYKPTYSKDVEPGSIRVVHEITTLDDAD